MPTGTAGGGAAGLRLFIPVHDNHVENLAALATHFPARVYLYDWAMCPEEARAFFERLGVPTTPFALTTLLRDVVEEPGRVVFVVSANPSHAVGKTQCRLFGWLKDRLPGKVIDVFHVGHCMYGCQSCALASHNLPLAFTRHHNGTLGCSAADLRGRLTPGRPTVLVAPSVFTLSLLHDRSVVDALCAAITQGTATFLVKPHPLLRHTNAAYPSFHRLDAEAAAIDRLLAAHGPDGVGPLLVDFWESGWSSLPALEVADVVVADADSSLPFEALAFPGTAVLAYTPPGHPVRDAALLDHYHVFSDGDGLRSLLARAFPTTTTSDPEHDAGPPLRVTSAASRAFFRSLYGEVDGQEPHRLAAQRGWLGSPAAAAAAAVPPDPSLLPTLTAEALRAIRSGGGPPFPSEQLIVGHCFGPPPELYHQWRRHSQRHVRPDPPAAPLGAPGTSTAPPGPPPPPP